MGVVIGELEVVAAPPPAEPQAAPAQPEPGLHAADVVRLVRAERERRARREAD